MILSVHQPQYLPWIGYLDKIRNSDVFVFLDNVQYKKREFQNRNKIRTHDGWMWLTVPVITKDRYFQKISEVEINNDENWTADHFKSIQCNYAHSKFFSDYEEEFKKIYDIKWQKLIDVSVHTINLLMKLFSLHTPVVFESTLNITTASTQRIIDICKKLNADTYLSGSGGKDYMDEDAFAQNNIKLAYQKFEHPAYKQNFEPFEPFMSAVDYLFNCGPKTW